VEIKADAALTTAAAAAFGFHGLLEAAQAAYDEP